MVTHLIYIYLITVAIFIGVCWEREEKWYYYLCCFIAPIVYIYVLFCNVLKKLYKNDYVFLIRIILGYKFKYKDNLLYQIKRRRNLKNKFWNYLADKVVNKLNNINHP